LKPCVATSSEHFLEKKSLAFFKVAQIFNMNIVLVKLTDGHQDEVGNNTIYIQIVSNIW